MYIYLSTWVHLDFCPLVLGSTAGLRNNWRTSRNSRIVITQYLDYLSKLWDTQLHEITNWYILQKRASGHKLKTGFLLTLKFDLRMLCEGGEVTQYKICPLLCQPMSVCPTQKAMRDLQPLRQLIRVMRNLSISVKLKFNEAKLKNLHKGLVFKKVSKWVSTEWPTLAVLR